MNESRKAFAVSIPSTVSRINRGVISNRYLDLVSHNKKKRKAANTTPLINSISSTLGLIRVFTAEIQIINKMNSCKAEL